MEEKLTIAGRTRSVALSSAEGGGVRIVIDGAALDARVASFPNGRHAVEIDGRLATLFTARSGAATWVWHRGRARLVERAAAERAAPAPTAAPRRGDGAAAPARPGAVTPPMPAVVVAVLVEPGRLVARGDPLVVVSAMKTETRLDAPVAGRVAAVNARVGARVRPGEVLVVIEPEGGSDAR
ncbi:MAG TPA: biotin/lipoyl-containing protein [Anaeromyxobacter sp.]